MKTLILATNNAGKLREMREILEPYGFSVCSMREAGIQTDPEETGTTFAENAELKARAVYDVMRTPVIADDSGLCVDALDGAPGVYSHRFAGEGASDADRNRVLLSKLEGVPAEKRTARFVCCVCYLDAEGVAHFFTGKCEGVIGPEPRGENGFGYDPLFYVEGRSLAERTAEEKNKISHRGSALRQLEAYLQKEQQNVDR